MFEDGRDSILVYGANERRAVYAIGVSEDQQLRGVGWADDGRVTYVVSQTFRPGQVLPQRLVTYDADAQDFGLLSTMS